METKEFVMNILSASETVMKQAADPFWIEETLYSMYKLHVSNNERKEIFFFSNANWGFILK